MTAARFHDFRCGCRGSLTRTLCACAIIEATGSRAASASERIPKSWSRQQLCNKDSNNDKRRAADEYREISKPREPEESSSRPEVRSLILPFPLTPECPLI